MAAVVIAEDVVSMVVEDTHTVGDTKWDSTAKQPRE